ncbi:hypothetical protein PV328_007980 [Microctonus aethiopoides]|uniref:Uncharacterized protein n=1 Tax=Microctonus aethiopoides TaxID=144406 RepID=A0AA39C9V5_9HYME|nr:hypothetical protein PV328_007980 [Microctonus aethiopoides]
MNIECIKILYKMKLCKLLTIITMTVFILFISFMAGINAQESHVGLGDGKLISFISLNSFQ